MAQYMYSKLQSIQYTMSSAGVPANLVALRVLAAMAFDRRGMCSPMGTANASASAYLAALALLDSLYLLLALLTSFRGTNIQLTVMFCVCFIVYSISYLLVTLHY